MRLSTCTSIIKNCNSIFLKLEMFYYSKHRQLACDNMYQFEIGNLQMLCSMGQSSNLQCRVLGMTIDQYFTTFRQAMHVGSFQTHSSVTEKKII